MDRKRSSGPRRLDAVAYLPSPTAPRRVTYRADRRIHMRPAGRVWRHISHREAIEALQDSHRGQRGIRSDLVANVLNLLDVVQGWASGTGNGEGHTTYLQLGQALYGDTIVSGWDDAERLQASIYRWARRAELAGLLRMRELPDPDTGAVLGLRWQMLDPRLHCQTPAGVAQSVRAADWRRRRESRTERHKARSAPRRRLTGRAGTARWLRRQSACSVSFFDPGYRTTKRSSTPTGCPTIRDAQAPAGAREGRGPVNGVSAPASPADGVNGNGTGEYRRAPEPFRAQVTTARKAAKAAVGFDRAERLDWLSDEALAGRIPGAVVVFAAFEEWHGTKAWLSQRRWEQLRNALAIADRCADFGAGQPGAGAAHVIDCMLVPDQVVRLADPKRPRKTYGGPDCSLCFYVVELLHEARRWRAADRRRRAAR